MQLLFNDGFTATAPLFNWRPLHPWLLSEQTDYKEHRLKETKVQQGRKFGKVSKLIQHLVSYLAFLMNPTQWANLRSLMLTTEVCNLLK